MDGFCAGTLEGIFMSQASAHLFPVSSAAAEDTSHARVARMCMSCARLRAVRVLRVARVCALCACYYARCARLFRRGGIKVQSGELARKPKNKLVFNKWKGFVPEHWMGNLCG